MYKRLFQAPAQSYFLLGPRGTGKSTWLRQAYPRALFVDLLDGETFHRMQADPSALRGLLEAHPKVGTVVIDEIQKVPALLDAVHQRLENRNLPKVQFVLTGSSSRKLKRSGVNLLGGRVLHRSFHPFMAAEMGKDFRLEARVLTGMLPLVVDAPDPGQILQSYAALYLREEVQAEGLVRNLGNFSRFLQAMSLTHGARLNTSAVARECQVGQKTVEGYLGVLEDLLLGYRVPVFTKRASRHLAQHPKFYFMDTGVFQALRPRGPLDTTSEMGGAALEGLVAQHLKAWAAYSGGDAALHYWRTKSGLEVDFVLYGSEGFQALEVKSTRRPSSGDTRPLREFLVDYPHAKAYLLHTGRDRYRLDGILCIPCEEFLRTLVPGKTFPGS